MNLENGTIWDYRLDNNKQLLKSEYCKNHISRYLDGIPKKTPKKPKKNPNLLYIFIIFVHILKISTIKRSIKISDLIFPLKWPKDFSQN